jgi:hypothetical protein
LGRSVKTLLISKAMASLKFKGGELSDLVRNIIKRHED